MIDWHSHILPGMDDGSRDVDESLSMIGSLGSQGVDCVVATPHFYADDESVEEFLKRRQISFDELSANLPADAPNVVCGAEVRYFPGISHMEGLERLTIGNSRLLLLEMSMSRWTEYTVRELIELAARGNITVILAHIERYIFMQSSDVWDRLLDSGFLMQVNASFFSRFGTKRKALRLLDSGRIHLVGSDCHNMTDRSPRIGTAYDLITKKLGKSFVSEINEYGNSLLFI